MASQYFFLTYLGGGGSVLSDRHSRTWKNEFSIFLWRVRNFFFVIMKYYSCTRTWIFSERKIFTSFFFCEKSEHHRDYWNWFLKIKTWKILSGFSRLNRHTKFLDCFFSVGNSIQKAKNNNLRKWFHQVSTYRLKLEYFH